MRAMKRTVSVVLALVMVLGMMTMAISVSAAETNQITATSNFADSYSVDYNANANQVTVTYTFKTALKVVNFEGTATYDSSVLQLSEATFPGFNGEATANTEEYENTIYVNASNTNGYDFTGDGVAIANLVFNIVGTGNTTVNFDINEMTATTAVGTGEANDVDVFDESVATGDQAYTATATVTTDVPAVEFGTFLYRYRANLEGKVALRYMFRKAPAGYDTSKVTVHFADDKGRFEYTVPYTELTPSGNFLMFDYQLLSAMFASKVNCEIIYDGKVITSEEYSIEQYILDNLSSTTNEKLLTLYKALLNYGAAAQVQFKFDDANLANKGLSAADQEIKPITADQIVLPDGVGVEPSATELAAMGIEFRTEQAELLADTSLRIRFKVKTSADKAKFAAYTATVNGESIDFQYASATSLVGYYNVENIASALLDSTQELKFSNGVTYKTSVVKILKDYLTADPNHQLAKAMYWYNQAANEVFGK